MLQNRCKTLGFKKNMVYKIPPGGGGKPYPASGLGSETLCAIDTHIVRVTTYTHKDVPKSKRTEWA